MRSQSSPVRTGPRGKDEGGKGPRGALRPWRPWSCRPVATDGAMITRDQPGDVSSHGEAIGLAEVVDRLSPGEIHGLARVLLQQTADAGETGIPTTCHRVARDQSTL